MALKSKIIKLVEKYDCLYDIQSPHYKDYAYKQYLWNEIGEKVGISGDAAKREFKIARDNYKKWQNKVLTVPGYRNQYKYAQLLGFLDEHMMFRGAPIKKLTSLLDVENGTDVSSDLDFKVKTDLRSKVIEKVKQYECLYNMNSAQYKDEKYKQYLWNKFEKELNISAEQIKKMWISSKDCYKNYKSTGEIYKYAEELKFLDDYIVPQSEPTNQIDFVSLIDDDNGSDDDNDDDDEKSKDDSIKDNLDLLVELKVDENVKIIEAIRNYDCLYNVTSFQYKDFEYKNKIWCKIAKEVGISAEQAKNKWKSIKDYYRKCKLYTGTVYKYAEHLTFLDAYIGSQSGSMNKVVSSIDDETETDSSSDEEFDISEKIIEAVKKYDCLYNELSPQYKNAEYKQKIWNEIGDELGLPAKRVENIWDYIKDYFITYKQNGCKTYKYADQLKFLDAHINVNPQSSLSYEEVSTDLHLQIIKEVKRYKCLYNAESMQYRDFEYRQQIWSKIGKKLNISGENAKWKWKHIKCYYNRCKQNSKNKYKYAKHLKFLDRYTVMQCKENNESISLSNEEVSTDLSSDLNDPERSADINVNIIEAVKKYDCLYNPKSPAYKDDEQKQKIWNQIAEELDISKEQLKNKWNNLTYRYKTITERILDKGSGSYKKFKYMENLKFLDDDIGIQREVTIDSSSDSDIIYIPPVKKKNVNMDGTQEEIQNFPVKKENKESTTSQWIEEENFSKLLEEEHSLSEKSVSIKHENPESTTNQLLVEEIQDNFSDKLISIKKENSESNTSQWLEEVNFEKSPEDKEFLAEEPISTVNLNKTKSQKSAGTSQWFELLAKKINESNITAEQKNEIEFAVSSVVYTKLAEFSKQNLNS